MNQTVQIRWVDQAKGIGIILVVIGHTLGDLNIFMSQYQLIYAFHMPLFFILSGYLCSSKIKDSSINYELKKNFKQLLIPYLFFGFLSYFILISSWCELKHGQTWEELFMPIIKLLMGMDAKLSCETKASGLINAPLWFFSCLFITKIIFYLLTKLIKNNLNIIGCAIILSLVGHLYHFFEMPRLPMHTDVALVAILFYAIGYFCRSQKIIAENNVTGIKFLVISLLVFIVFYLAASINQSVALAGPYGNIPLFYIVAKTGSWLVVIVARSINSFIISYLGFMSIAIFPTHDFIARYIFIPKVIGKINWYSIKITEVLPWFNVEYAYLGYQVSVEIVLACFLGSILIEFFPVLIGNRYKCRFTHNE